MPRAIVAIARAAGVNAQWLIDNKGPIYPHEAVGAPDRPWPMPLIPPETWEDLSEREKGVVEQAAFDAVEKVMDQRNAALMKRNDSRTPMV